MKLTLQQLEAHLWGAANILRGKTAGQDYKNYILSLMFYKRLCDQWECEADDAIAELERQQGRAFTEQQKAVFRKRGEHRFKIPESSRWGDVKAASTNIGEVLTKAMRAVSDAIRRARAGLSDPNRPLGSFFFLGPTGVGKTELAKALAELLFDDAHALVRIDMSEFMERHTVSRLIGAPPGYVGYEEGGQLTEPGRRKPYCVILFDEVEKAHQDVLNVLLQLLDDGRLTDGQGRVVSFKNTVVIMTSNVGSHLFSEQRAADSGQRRENKEEILEELRKSFRPEFLNRIDEIVIFNRLSDAELGKIVELQVQQAQTRLADRRVTLVLTPKAKQYLATVGYDPAYGARPLRRAIQRELMNPLAKRLLEGKIQEGATVTVDRNGQEGLSFAA